MTAKEFETLIRELYSRFDTVPFKYIKDDYFKLIDAITGLRDLLEPEILDTAAIKDVVELPDPAVNYYTKLYREDDKTINVETADNVYHDGLVLCASLTSGIMINDPDTLREYADPTEVWFASYEDIWNIYSYLTGEAAPVRFGTKSSSGYIDIYVKKNTTLIFTPFFGYNPSTSKYDVAIQSANIDVDGTTVANINITEAGHYDSYLDIPRYEVLIETGDYYSLYASKRVCLIGMQGDPYTEKVYNWNQVAFKDYVDTQDQAIQTLIDNLATVSTTGSYNDLSDTPEIGDVQIYDVTELPTPATSLSNKIYRVDGHLYELAESDNFILDFENWPYSTISCENIVQYCKSQTGDRNLLSLDIWSLEGAWQKVTKGLQLGNSKSSNGNFCFAPELKQVRGTSCATFTQVTVEIWPYRESENCYIAMDIDNIGDSESQGINELLYDGSQTYALITKSLSLDNSDYFFIRTDTDNGRRAIIKRVIFSNLTYDGELLHNEYYWKEIPTTISKELIQALFN